MDCDSASVLIFGALGWPYRHPRPPTGPRRSVLVARAPRSPDDPRAVCLPNLSASSGTPGRAARGSLFSEVRRCEVERPTRAAQSSHAHVYISWKCWEHRRHARGKRQANGCLVEASSEANFAEQGENGVAGQTKDLRSASR